ncbi:MAG: oxidoreductase [Gammaproteobacteria bacterium RIFCSPLOWO2_02_FULL_61_13]|nr:MAG: oxidoreductase [Gammaproteobacteria bacterium RIFCSPLOWO2_02_FULL_61_13]
MKAVGVIGLGAMGAPMARNFHKHGLLHAVWNRSPQRAEAVATETGARIAKSPADLARDCDFIVTCVSRDQDVIDMATQLAQGIQPGAIVADTSTVSAATAREAARLLKDKGAHFLDCPVSGGTEGAIKGTLAMMVGGDAEIFEKSRPMLSAIAAKVVHIGPTGSGQACKAVNQLMIAGVYEAVAEAIAFGQSLGLDMQRVVEVLSTGAAANWVLTNRSANMLNMDFPLGFKVALHHKDLEICRAMARDADGAVLPVAERMLANYEELMRQGYDDEDVSAVFRLKRGEHT